MPGFRSPTVPGLPVRPPAEEADRPLGQWPRSPKLPPAQDASTARSKRPPLASGIGTPQALLALLIVICIVAAWLCFAICGPRAFVSWAAHVIPLQATHRTAVLLVVSMTTIMALGVPFMHPLFATFGGLIFGAWRGAAINLTGQLLGVILCICVGRSLLRDDLRHWLMHGSWSKRIVRILEDNNRRQNWCILVSIRFAHIPLVLKNYAPTILDLPPWQLIVAAIPHEVVAASLWSAIGASLKNVSDLLEGPNQGSLLYNLKAWQVLALSTSWVAMGGLGYCAYKVYEDTHSREADLLRESGI